jgi:hypothetical protein
VVDAEHVADRPDDLLAAAAAMTTSRRPAWCSVEQRDRLGVDHRVDQLVQRLRHDRR